MQSRFFSGKTSSGATFYSSQTLKYVPFLGWVRFDTRACFHLPVLVCDPFSLESPDLKALGKAGHLWGQGWTRMCLGYSGTTQLPSTESSGLSAAGES